MEEPVISVRRPGVYLIKPGFDKVIETLQRHGVEVEVLREDVDLNVESYKVAKITRAERAFQGHKIVGLDVTATSADRRIPAGTFVVKTAQKLGDLVVYLLEPQCEDGLAAWNFFDAGLEQGSEYPVLRVLSLPTLLTTKVRPLPEDRASNKPITYDMLYGGGAPPNFTGSPTTITRFLEDGEHFVQYKNGQAYKVHATTGKSEPMASSAKPPAVGRRAPARVDSSIEEKDGDLYLNKQDGSKPVRLTKSPEKKKELASLSPGGKYVAFVHANNLYLVDVATQTERALTTDGSATMFNGKADWVYFEEIFNRDWRAYWWSGDGEHLAFLHFDDKGVKKFTVVDHIPVLLDVELTPYPKSGDPNPLVTVKVAASATGVVHELDTANYPPATSLFPRAGFMPDGKTVYFFAQDRVQTWLDLCVASVEGGPVQKLLHNTTQAYVEDPGEPFFLKDGSFLLTNEHTGWRHFYHYGATGSLMGAVTSGPWEVRSLVHVDQDKGLLYFMGMMDDPIGANLYRVKLDGTELQRLTMSPGDHRVVFSPKANLFVDIFSNPTTPTQTLLYRTDGRLVRTLDTNPVYSTEEYKLGAYEAVQIPTPDGFQIEGSVLLPPDFDAKKKYPVWFTTYAGPHTPTMRNAWVADQMRDQLLANMGIVVFHCDPRSRQRQRRHLYVQGLQTARHSGIEGHRDSHQMALPTSLYRRQPDRHERPQLWRFHDGIRHDALQPVRGRHCRRSGHRLAQLRHDLYRALHEHAAAQPRGLCQNFSGDGGEEPAWPVADSTWHHGRQCAHAEHGAIHSGIAKRRQAIRSDVLSTIKARHLWQTLQPSHDRFHPAFLGRCSGKHEVLITAVDCRESCSDIDSGKMRLGPSSHGMTYRIKKTQWQALPPSVHRCMNS